MTPTWVKGLFAAFALIGLGLGTAGARFYREQNNILKNWPTAEAEVTQSTITTSRSSNSGTMYGAEVEFRYTVDNQQYTATWTPGYTTSSRSSMAEKVRKFAPGSHHPIRHNPVDPGDMRAEVGYTFGFFMLPLILGGMGLVFGGIGVFGFIGTFRSKTAQTCPACGQPIESGQKFCPQCAAPLTH